MRFRDLAIQRKMILIIMSTNTVAILLVCAGFVLHDVVTFRRNLLDSLSVLAAVIGSNSTAALSFDDRAAAKETLAALRAEPHIVAAAIYGADAQVFATYLRDVRRSDFRAPPPGPEGPRFDNGHVALFRPITLQSERLGTLYLLSDLEAMRRRLDRYAQIVLVVIVSSSVVALLLSSRLQKLISEPILHLAHTAATVSAKKDYSLRVAKGGADEIGTLIDTFNAMLLQVQEHEKALQERTRQLEAANKELESFSYSVSHDLRVPVRAIDGFSLILLEEHAQDLDAEAQRLLQVIRSSTRQMGQLIDDLLQFSRYGRRALTWSEVDMSGLAREVMQELLALEPERRVEVRWGALPALMADRGMLRLVLVNLLSNALKFTRRQDDAWVEIGSRLEAGETVYCVRDNGVGFDMRFADKLFNVFQRLHSVEEFEGNGIGLAIVQRIVHQHGGRIWASAEVGRGAAFSFTIPLPAGAGG